MLKNQIKVGGLYLAKVSGVITTVRVDAIREVTGVRPMFGRTPSATHYTVTNLRTGRKVVFRSAAKFRCEAKPPQVDPQDAGKADFDLRVQEAIETAPQAEEASEETDPTQDTDAPTSVAPILERCSVASAVPALSAAPEPASANMVHAQSTVLSGLACRIAASRPTRVPGTPVAGMVPNAEQEEILAAAVQDGLRALVIAAGAGCLAGDTIIHVNRATKGFEIPIRDLVARQSGEQPVITRTYQMRGKTVTSTQRNHPWDLTIPTRIARAENGLIRLCDLSEVWYSGEKETYTLSTTSGRTIRATAIHPFLTDSGEWVQLQNLKPGDVLQVNSGRSSRGRGSKLKYHQTFTRYHSYQVSRSNSRYRMSVATHRLVVEANINGLTLRDYIRALNREEVRSLGFQYLPPNQLVHHINENTLDNSLSNLKVVDGQVEHSDEHEWMKNVLWQVGYDTVESIELYGIESTYDIEVAGDPHNFIANGFVVHNTGKTATLEMLEQVLPGRGQYTAFNTSLVAESKAKFVKASCNTTHSLAFRAVGKVYQHRLGGERMRSSQVARILGIESFPVVLRGQGPPEDCQLCERAGRVGAEPCPACGGNGTVPSDKTKVLQADYLAGQVLVAIRRFCQSADREIGSEHLRYIDGIDVAESNESHGMGFDRGQRSRENNDKVREYLLPFCRRAWNDLSRVDGTLPFNHDCYVKLWQLGQGQDRPIIAADYILLDEAQDTAPVFLSILQQQTHALLVFVGDSNQQIYEWRGAVDAMRAYPDAERRLLTQSYRFGQAVADVANAVLATLDEPTDLVMRGNPVIPSRVAEVASPRCYLYRTNAGTVGRVMAAIGEGKRPHLIGGGADVVAWCQAAIDLQAGRGTRHPELACFESWNEVVDYSKTDEGSDLKLMVKLVTDFGAEEIRDALRNMPKEEDADLVVSTAHKSKGREWDTVRLGQDFPLANKMGDADRRLLYVAATRAKLVLDVSECPPFCGDSDNRDTGNAETSGAWVPGLEIHYTQPMPSPDDLSAYMADCMAGNGPGSPVAARSPAATAAAPTPVPSVPTANGNGATGEFTWAKMDGEWCVRGSKDRAGQQVRVVRKNGTSSVATLGKVTRKIGDFWFYEVK